MQLAGLQQLQEVDSALAVRTGKPGKPVVADLRHIAVAALMPGTGIIYADPATDPALCSKSTWLSIQ